MLSEGPAYAVAHSEPASQPPSLPPRTRTDLAICHGGRNMARCKSRRSCGFGEMEQFRPTAVPVTLTFTPSSSGEPVSQQSYLDVSNFKGQCLK